jgi:hypothetical protein
MMTYPSDTPSGARGITLKAERRLSSSIIILYYIVIVVNYIGGAKRLHQIESGLVPSFVLYQAERSEAGYK